MTDNQKPRLAPIALAALFALLAPAGASADATAALERQLGPGVDVAADAETGRQVTFVGTRAGRAIPLQGRTAGRAAREAARSFAPAFGLRAGEGATLPVEEIDRHGDGRSTVRFQQEIDGLPVIGGELVVNLDESNDLLSVGGELEPAAPADTAASVGEGEAAATARAAVAKKHGLRSEQLLAGPGELSIYDSRILGGPGLGVPRPVWRFEVVDTGDPRTVRELVLIDARLGNVALSFSEIHEAKVRRVCDAEEAEAKVPCTEGGAARLEGQAETGTADVDAAYDESGGVYDFFSARFGRDSIDGEGMHLISTANFCEEDKCPYLNASWNGEQMIYGPGMVTEDIAGHELAHGVTEHDSGLFYYYQSGAINESLSDVFGELYDLANGSDPAADRWLVGEGSTFEEVLGRPLRNMKHPPQFKDPDRTGSANWFFEPEETSLAEGDAGGVHSNSGVNNKAAYLLTDGDSFNGRAVTGLGIDKVLQIYYEVNHKLLGSASDYQDLGNALRQACATLTGEHGISAADCDQVDEAVLATEMDEPVAEGAPQVAQVCGEGGTAETLFFDDLENTGSGNWAKSAVLNESGKAGFRYPQPANFTYATSGTTNIWGYDAPGVSDSRIAMTSDVTVPAGGWMHFNHAFGFELSEGTAWDGGVVEYRTVGEGVWRDAGDLIHAGRSYSGVISDEAGNPLENRQAFAGESGGYGSTRLDLSSLEGEQVRFRFRLGTDEFVDDYGWFIDDVQIYSCNGADPEDGLPEEEPEEQEPDQPDDGEPDDSGTDGNDGGAQAVVVAPPPTRLASPCVAQRTRFRRGRTQLRRAVRRVKRSKVAVRRARGGKPKAKAKRRLRGARKGVKRKRRGVKRARVRLRACLVA